MFSVICATRGRPNFMERLYNSLVQTISDSTKLEVMWYIDEDDQISKDKAVELNTMYISAKRGEFSLAEAYNKMANIVRGEYIYAVGDDVVFHTPHWDVIVEKAFDRYPDKILLAGGMDGLNKQLITHPVVHKNWIKALGRLNPPFFRDCYIDTWMNEVARTVGRLEWLPIYVEHLHFSCGKMQYDQTAQERMSKIQKFDEAGQKFLTTKLERLQEANKLERFINSFK